MPTNTTHRDDKVIAQVLAGQRDHFGVLVERYLPMVQAIAYARVRSTSDVDDIAQETFLKAFQNLDQLRERAKFPGWLARIARNAAVAILKQRGQDSALQSEPRSEAPDFARRELRLAIREHIEKLDADAREVVLLHYFAGASGREIARIVDASEPAVRKRLQRAREALGEQLLTTFQKDDALAVLRSENAKRILTTVLAAGATWSRVSGAAAAATSGAVLTGALTAGKLAAFAAFVAIAAGVILISGEEEPTPEPISDDALSEIPTPTPLDVSVPDDSPQLARVEGVTLLGQSGDPLKGVAIQLRRESDGEFVEPPAKSGDDGAFRFEGLTSGTYTLVAEHESHVAKQQPHTFAIYEKTKAHWLEVVMIRGGAISGRVYDASTMEGIAGVKVGLLQEMDPSGTTDANGSYIVTGMPVGKMPVYREFVRGYMRGKDADFGVPIEVALGRTTEGVDFSLMKGVFALIQGRVVDEQGHPVAGAKVRAVDNNDTFNRDYPYGPVGDRSQ